ncbi:MAG: hypothetical protein O6834_08490 [Actinobacteria bacterium]|nr:hypothetical protein [Actinomycetota bacterium]
MRRSINLIEITLKQVGGCVQSHRSVAMSELLLDRFHLGAGLLACARCTG